LGLTQFDPLQDQLLTENLLQTLQSAEIDMTIFYRLLARVSIDGIHQYTDQQWVDIVRPAYYLHPDKKAEQAMANWLRTYSQRLQQDYVVNGNDDQQRRQRMNAVNPKYGLRNYLAQQAIDKAAEGDNSEVEKLLQILRKPYDEQPEYEDYFAKRPEWARHKAGCSMLSCSS
jgi:uncharacterized protein YdiU (UPF0061 family)